MPLLTIAIPTFNRADKLESLLQRIAASSISQNGQVAVICINNASEDRTVEVLTIFQSSYSGMFSHHTNRKNCGAVGNIIKCFEKSSSDYTWVLGDDDVPDFSHINEIVDCLKHGSPSGMLLNAAKLSDPSTSLFSAPFPEDSEESKRAFTREVFRTTPGWFMWISCQILRTQLALEAYNKLPSATHNLAAPLYSCMTCVNSNSFVFFKTIAVFNNDLGPTSWIKYGRVLNWLDMPLVYQQMIADNIMPSLAEQNLKQFFKTFRLRSLCGLILRHPSPINIKRLALMLLWQIKRVLLE